MTENKGGAPGCTNELVDGVLHLPAKSEIYLELGKEKEPFE